MTEIAVPPILGATTATLPLLRGEPAPDADRASPRAPVPRLPGLSVVLPCFNEEANVADAIRYAAFAAAEASERYEIVVVSDGSTDATADLAAALAATDARIRLVVHAVNRGYGEALRSGLDAAVMPWILLTDADLQFDLHELQGFLPYAREADLLVGRRINRQDPPLRRLNAALWNWLVRGLFRLPIRDVDCAFKLMRADLAHGIELTADGAMISTELVVKALAAGARLRELQVHHRPRVAGAQTGARPRVVLRAFLELARLHKQLRALVAGSSPDALG